MTVHLDLEENQNRKQYQDHFEYTKNRPIRLSIHILIIMLMGYVSFVYLVKGRGQSQHSFHTFVIGGNLTVTIEDNQKNIKIDRNSTKIRENPRKLCNCKNLSAPKNFVSGSNDSIKPASVRLPQSTCSDEATNLGPGQKVISFSLFSPPMKEGTKNNSGIDRRLLVGLQRNLEEIKKFYPGWVTRVYSNIDLNQGQGHGQGHGQGQSQGHPQLCPLICNHTDDLFFCDVKDLPTLGNVDQPSILPMSWRFLVLGDPTVRKFLVRDLDSRPSQRERDAVAQWENSSFPLHGMRDHYLHYTEMMGGMWGGDNVKLGQNISQAIQREILRGKPANADPNFSDQSLLKNVIYEKYKKLLLTHDSYLCYVYHDSVPFPSKRPNNYEFVGLPIYPDENNTETGKASKLTSFCPKECRPSYGQKWKYC